MALVIASSLSAKDVSAKATLVGVAALSPVTDLTLSGATYETRADGDPYFTREQGRRTLSALELSWASLAPVFADLNKYAATTHFIG